MSNRGTAPRHCVDQLMDWLRFAVFSSEGRPGASQGARDDGSVFELGHCRYIISDGIPYDPPVIQDQPLLVSVLRLTDVDNCTAMEQLEIVLRAAENDDVFCDQFLQGVILLVPWENNEELGKSVHRLLLNRGNIWVDIQSHPGTNLIPGTYVTDRSLLRRVFRLYDDQQKVFLTTLKPRSLRGDSEPFEQLQIAGKTYATLGVAVPSRLQSRYLRIAVKDLFRVHGLKTSLCNSSYYQLSSPASKSASAVQKLVSQGHHILGLTKLSSMIAREEPSDAVDFQTSFNPRGDGYQSPAGSSSGSAAAVASYEWLDCALGTDTSGSGRRPALVNGIFQFRPSHDAAPLDGMVPTFLQFDTPCIFARNLEVLEDIMSAWVPRSEQNLEKSNSTLEIIYPFDYLPTRIPGQMALLDSFVDDMATHLNAVITKISIRKSWEEAPPNNASSDIEEFLKDVITHTYYYSFYHSSDTFRSEYFRTFNRKPYVIPFVEQRWASGAAVSAEEYEEGLRKLEVYKAWLLSNIFKNKRTLMVLPISPVEPHYRDERTESPSNQTATDELFLSPILGSPDIVIPIGEIPYQSRVTGNQEILPVAINVVGAPGSDYWILESMRTVLQKSGRPSKVKSGSRMF